MGESLKINKNEKNYINELTLIEISAYDISAIERSVVERRNSNVYGGHPPPKDKAVFLCPEGGSVCPSDSKRLSRPSITPYTRVSNFRTHSLEKMCLEELRNLNNGEKHMTNLNPDLKNKELLPKLWEVYNFIGNVYIDEQIHPKEAQKKAFEISDEILKLISLLKITSKRDREIKIKTLELAVDFEFPTILTQKLISDIANPQYGHMPKQKGV